MEHKTEYDVEVSGWEWTFKNTTVRDQWESLCHLYGFETNSLSTTSGSINTPSWLDDMVIIKALRGCGFTVFLEEEENYTFKEGLYD